MDRLSFPQLVSDIEKELQRDGFLRVSGEVLIRSEDAGICPWISLAGTEFSFNPVLGVCSNGVDLIVNKALRKVFPSFKKSELPIPLFRVTPEGISPGDNRIICSRKSVPGYDATEASGFIKWLRDIGYPFLMQNVTLEKALELALKWNKYDQAQQYYIPALMLLLGRQDDKDAYVHETVSTFRPEAREIASLYKQFSQELEKIFAENLRKNKH